MRHWLLTLAIGSFAGCGRSAAPEPSETRGPSAPRESSATPKISANPGATQTCHRSGVWLQVLGAGGPELEDLHASTGYLVWIDGKARVLVDIGGGVALRFGEARADVADLDAIAISHFHVDHSAGLPELIKGAFFGERDRPLPLFGPEGNDFMPSAKAFVAGLFGEPNGVYRYLSAHVTPGSGAAYQLVAEDVPVARDEVWRGFSNERVQLSAIPVHHGALPALAWRVDIAGRSITFTGDTSGLRDTVPTLARETTILVAHNAIPEETKDSTARKLHMTPSVIGQIASRSGATRLILSHRMRRSFGAEAQTTTEIRRGYQGPLEFAEDLACFEVK